MNDKIPDCPPELLPEYAKLGRIEKVTQSPEYMGQGPAVRSVQKLQALCKEKTLELGAIKVLVEEMKGKIKLLESGDAILLTQQELIRLKELYTSETERLTKALDESKREIVQLKRVIDDMLPKEPSLGDIVGFRRPRSPR